MIDLAALFAEFAEPVATVPVTVPASLPVRPDPVSVRQGRSRTAQLAVDLAALVVAEPDRLPWPEDWLTGADPGDARRCRELWAEAFRQNIIDELRRSYRDAKTDGRLRIGWLFSKEFDRAADLAGFDPEAVSDALRRCLTPLSVQSLAATLGRFGVRPDQKGAADA